MSLTFCIFSSNFSRSLSLALLSFLQDALSGSILLSALSTTDDISGSEESKHSPIVPSSSRSSFPYSLLHVVQLGTFHFSMFVGVESGYQETGKTWSQFRVSTS